MKKFSFLLISLLLLSCSNKTDVKIIGINLDNPCVELVKQIESKGFKTVINYKQEEISSDENITISFKGEYLGEDEVNISVYGKKNGHYTSGMLTKLFTDDSNLAKQFFRKICRTIKKEHDGFEEEKISLNKVEYYNENGDNISINLSFGCVLVLYNLYTK